MRVFVVAMVPGYGAAEDQEMAERLGFADGSAEGCRLRISGPMDGGRRIATLWDSEAAFEEWRDTRLAPVLKATGTPVPPFEVWPIELQIGQ